MDLQELGKRICILRKQNKYSQSKVADDLGISVTAYTRFENGQTNLSFHRLIQLSDYFECRLDILLSPDFTPPFVFSSNISSDNFSSYSSSRSGEVEEIEHRFEIRFEEIERQIAQLETQLNLLHKQLKQ